MIVIVDASVAVLWLVAQERSDSAQALLESIHELVALDLTRLEVMSAVLRLTRSKRLSQLEANVGIERFRRVPMRLLPASDYAADAYAIAQRHGGSVYDACYIALARSLDAPLVTDDEAMAKTAETVGVAVHRASQGFAALLD
ncbi:MAG: type II toxin-antitoxin system VapC family toxin [Rhodospirillales bacterium]|nr:type II toxin-antitoxin system VapC family toxin [Rhodospirillales bacterium]